MANDFGLLVGRYNSATPILATDKELRELRLDEGGRVYARLADGNDNRLSYFEDGDAVGSGNPDDRGVLILGLNDTNNNYQIFRVNDDGSLVVSLEAGTDASAAADGTGGTYVASPGDSEGEIALVIGDWKLLQSVAIPTGKIHVDGWSFGSDKGTIFQLCLVNDVGGGGVTRADVTEILDTQMNSSANPSDHAGFNRAMSRAGGANIHIAVFAKQLQAGNTGVGFSMVNAHKTS